MSGILGCVLWADFTWNFTWNRKSSRSLPIPRGISREIPRNSTWNTGIEKACPERFFQDGDAQWRRECECVRMISTGFAECVTKMLPFLPKTFLAIVSAVTNQQTGVEILTGRYSYKLYAHQRLFYKNSICLSSLKMHHVTYRQYKQR